MNFKKIIINKIKQKLNLTNEKVKITLNEINSKKDKIEVDGIEIDNTEFQITSSKSLVFNYLQKKNKCTEICINIDTEKNILDVEIIK